MHSANAEGASPPQLSVMARWPVEDRDAWLTATNESQLFSPLGPVPKWRPATKLTIAKSYNLWLRFLHSDDPDALRLDLAQRVTAERVATYIESMTTQLSSRSRFTYIYKLYAMMRTLRPEQDWRWLRDVTCRLRRQAHSRRKVPIIATPDLFSVGTLLIETSNTAKIRGCIRYRDGLMIALLACRPLRLKNLAMVRVGRHLTRSADGYRLSFDETETKNWRFLDFDVPATLTDRIDTYLTSVRPRLRAETIHNGMWPSLFGPPLRSGSIRSIIASRTYQVLGVEVWPQVFRISAATSVAEKLPERFADIPAILGNTSQRVVENHYNLASTLEASRRHAEVITTAAKAIGATFPVID